MEKIAVDQKAKSYWSEYFKDYGQIWVRDIPRRIKQATIRKLKAETATGEFAPMAANVLDNGGLSVEAAFIGKLDNKSAKIMVTASFSEDGKLQEFVCNQIS